MNNLDERDFQKFSEGKVDTMKDLVAMKEGEVASPGLQTANGNEVDSSEDEDNEAYPRKRKNPHLKMMMMKKKKWMVYPKRNGLNVNKMLQGVRNTKIKTRKRLEKRQQSWPSKRRGKQNEETY